MAPNPNFSSRSRYDYNLVIAAKDGDQRAYSELLDRYRSVVYYMLLKLIKNDRDADELTIEVFEKAFLKLHQYTPEYAFCTWLFKIAYNYGLDYLRKKARQRHVSIDNADENFDPESLYHLACPNPDPEELLISKQKDNIIHNAVDKLKPHYRDLVHLHYFKEFSFVEIKDMLNMPLGTVKIRMFRSREILQNKLRRKKTTLN